MKNLKNIVSIFTLTVIMFVSTNASSQVIIDNGSLVFDPTNSTQLDIPEDMKSQEMNSNNLTTISKYVKEFKGNLTVTFDLDGNIVSAFVPKSMGSKALVNAFNSRSTRGPFRECYKDCRGDVDGDVNAGICYYICLVEMWTQ